MMLLLLQCVAPLNGTWQHSLIDHKQLRCSCGHAASTGLVGMLWKDNTLPISCHEPDRINANVEAEIAV